MNIRILGNASWKTRFTKRPAGSTNKQSIWILIYNPGGTNYSVQIESALHNWDENPAQRELQFLNSRFRVLILKANPSKKPLPPGPFALALVETDTLTVTVTNTTTGDMTDDTIIIEMVDEGLFKKVTFEINDDTLLRGILEQDGDGTSLKATDVEGK